jgi:WD40 repeat protein
MSGSAGGDHRYWAFLSYSHADARWSNWLHRRLETYRVPKRLAGRATVRGYPVPKRLFPIFRDRDEIPSSADLSETIQVALRQSRYLVVICSPRAAASLWVNQEIRAFKAAGGHNRILALVVEGEPNATDRPGSGEPEAFPEALRFRVTPDGGLTRERAEPIAADARPGKDGRDNALLKLLAGLLGVGFDELRQRERARRRKRRLLWSVGAALLVALGVGGWQWQESRRALALRERQSRADLLSGGERLAQGDVRGGALYLARALRANPELRAAALGLADLLRRRRFALPLGPLLVHREEILAAVFTPDGSRIVTGSSDGTARIWDALTGGPVGASLEHPGAVHGIGFRADGRRMLTASGWHFQPGVVLVWDPETGTAVLPPLRHPDFVLMARFDSGGTITTRAADRRVRTWDGATGALIADREAPEPAAGGGAGLRRESPDRSRTAEAGAEGSVLVRDSGAGLPVVEPIRQEGEITALDWSPDGDALLVASGARNRGGWARVWLIGGAAPAAAQPVLEDAGYLAAWSPDGAALVTAGGGNDGGPLSLWTAQTLDRAWGPVPLRGRVQQIEPSPDGRVILAATGHCGQGGAVTLFDARTGQPAVPVLEHLNGVLRARFSPDGDKVLSASCGQTARLWDARTGAPLGEFLQHGDRVNWIEFSPDGSRLLTTSGVQATEPWLRQNERRADAVWLWDAASGRLLLGPLTHPNAVTKATFHPDGRSFAVAVGSEFRGGTAYAQIRDAGSGAPRSAEFPLEGSADGVEWSPDGHRLLTTHSRAGKSGTVQLWDPRTGARIGRPMGHAGSITMARFSADGSWILTASRDSTARIWDAHTGHPAGEPWRHDGPVETAQFSPDGRRAVTASRFGTVRVWDLSLPERGSLVQLADLIEAVLGAALTDAGTVVPASRSLAEVLAGFPDAVERFPLQFRARSARLAR